MAYGKINGFHTAVASRSEGIGEFLQRLDAAGVPFTAKCVDGTTSLVDAQNIARRSNTPHTLVFRRAQFAHNQGGTDVPDYTRDPAEAAREQWGSHVARWPQELDPALVYSEIINEPRKEVEWASWIGEFLYEAASLALARGWRFCGPGYSTGTPDEGAWETPGMLKFLRLASRHPDMLAVALHEYSLDPTDIWAGDGHLIGRFRNLVDACARHSFDCPQIIFTEWGWADRDVPNTHMAMRHVDQVNAFLADYPQVRGASIWALDNGWGIGHKVNGYMTELAEMLATTAYPAQPRPQPEPEPQPKNYVVRVHLFPPDADGSAVDRVARIAEQGLETMAWSADDAGRLVEWGKPESRVIVWNAHEWPDDIEGWLMSNYKARVEHRRLGEPESPPTRPQPPSIVRRIGSDISHHQGEINWTKFFAPQHKLSFLYVRTGYGSRGKDRFFLRNWEAATARADIPHGIYHYYLNDVNPEAQAEFAIRRVAESGKGWGTLPPMIDAEHTSGTIRPSHWLRFIRRLAREVDWHEEDIVIYTGRWFWNGVRFGRVDWAHRHPTYLASYVNDPYDWDMPTEDEFAELITPEDWVDYGVKTPTIWQYTSSGARERGVGSVGLDLGVVVDHSRFDSLLRASRGRVGLHASADGGDIGEGEIEAFRTLRPGVIKVLSNTQPSSVRALANASPGATVIIRAFLSFGGRRVTPDSFVQWTLPDVQRCVDVLDGRDVLIELHNEPNLYAEGLGSTWANGVEFSMWIQQVLAQYAANLNHQIGGTLGFMFPGLSPGGDIDGVRVNSWRFLGECAEALARFDALGVHVYWATQNGWPMSRALEELKTYRELLPNTPIWVTEASNNASGITADEKAVEYARFVRSLTAHNISGVTFFVASAINPAWDWEGGTAETWTPVGMATKVSRALDGRP